ncbi:YidC/Oxa1 family membrane protein insertase [Catalinimonas alkaloidigena]|uniref:membrane protein insertase YidC n=1 Tax=Catalinimonas alkaloidigena TaxID=1075417 RepID=UPI002404EDF9|nr:membrane protein insertase YidC [Catalinimonas alkaloidigena]MDF9798447.1 YidC/Oxa1 family membrane protein insertase [Catalinimonas alkaloidigena]
MDRNQAIGLLLSGLLLIVYFQFFAPEPAPPAENEQQAQQVDEAPAQQQEPVMEQDAGATAEKDSLQQARNRERYGVFAQAASGAAETITVESEDVLLEINTHGGTVERVELKNYKDGSGNQLVLFNEESSDINLLAATPSGEIDLYNLYYNSDASEVSVSGEDTTVVTLSAKLDGGGQIRQVYSIPGRGYEISYHLELQNATGALNSSDLQFLWSSRLRPLEQNMEESRRRSSLNYYTADGDFEQLSSLMGDGAEEETVEVPLKWITMKQRFFSAAVIADESFSQARLTTDSPEEDNTTLVKTMNMAVNMGLEDLSNGTLSYKYYFGPNDQQVMTKVAPDFEENIDFGWPIVKWISKYPISYMFHWLEQFISNYGVIIIILVLVIKTLLFPLSYKSYISMAKIKVLKPELDEIKEKHGDDMAKAQQDQMQLYQKVGVNPLSGCVPVLLQMPILLAMFNYFPNAIELRQEPFLWAEDLSTYDSILDLPFTIPFYGDHVSLFVLLMTASTILYTWSNNQASTVQGPMKNMQYFLPLIFMFVLNSFPAALSFYYFVSNIVTFGQQAIIRKFVDDEKIRKILDENKKRNKNKKKSKFQQRLEEAMKASEDSRKNGNKGGGNKTGRKGK